ncbi:MAG: hypothetical protein IKV17_02295 [Bacteroidaceae bacterium]|nr:hypothetical protein [Bacteroidaceae bacterium]
MRFYSIVTAITLLLTACSNGTQEWEPKIIAHAAGGIDGDIYTNSLEALTNSIEAGYKYIEFDLLFTADSVLVATHSWEEYNTLCGQPQKGDSAPTLSAFLSQRIMGKYTPLTAQQINSIFESDSTLFLVTDKTSSPDIIKEYFPNIKERTIVEAFSYEDYTELNRQGYHKVLYSCLAHDITEGIVKHIILHHFFKGEKIEWLSLHTSAFDHHLFKLIDIFSHYKAALFTVNDKEIVPQKHRKNIEYIYTDNIIP